MSNIRVLLHLPKQRSHVKQRIYGVFQYVEEFGLHVFDGRALPVAEFNRVAPKYLGADHMAIRPLVTILDPDAAPEDAQPGTDLVTLPRADVAAVMEENARLRQALDAVGQRELGESEQLPGETPDATQPETPAETPAADAAAKKRPGRPRKNPAAE